MKLEGFCNASPQILPHARVVKPEGFYNSQGGIEGEVEGGVGFQPTQENDVLESLPQPASDLRLTGRAPLSAHWKLMRNGKLLSETTGSTMEVKLAEPGNYRAELWLDVAGEEQVWILSNPIYVTAE